MVRTAGSASQIHRMGWGGVGWDGILIGRALTILVAATVFQPDVLFCFVFVFFGIFLQEYYSSRQHARLR